MTTRRATLHCSHPDHNPHYLPLSDECPGFDFNSLVGHEGASVIELTERTDIHTYSTEYWRWYETERELVEPPREDSE